MVIASFRRVCAYLLVPVLGGVAPGVFAGAAPSVGEIVYEPLAAATAVPTLSEWGLMAMMGLLVLVAYRVLRERLQGKPLASVVLAGVLGLGVVSGGHWGNTVLAAEEFNPFQFSNPLGGTFPFSSSGLWKGTNTSGVPQRITAIIASPGVAFAADVPGTACTVGAVVPVSGICYVRLGYIGE